MINTLAPVSRIAERIRPSSKVSGLSFSLMNNRRFPFCYPFRFDRVRAFDNHYPKTLLAVVLALPAKLVVGDTVSLIGKQRPFLFPLFAHSRHTDPTSFPSLPGNRKSPCFPLILEAILEHLSLCMFKKDILHCFENQIVLAVLI